MDPNNQIDEQEYKKQLDYINNFGASTPISLPGKKKISKKIILLATLGVVSVGFFVFTLLYKPKDSSVVVANNQKNITVVTDDEAKQAINFVNTILAFVNSDKQEEIKPLLLEGTTTTVPLSLPASLVQRGVSSLKNCVVSNVSDKKAFIVKTGETERKMYYVDAVCKEGSSQVDVSFEMSVALSGSKEWRLHRVLSKN